MTYNYVKAPSKSCLTLSYDYLVSCLSFNI